MIVTIAAILIGILAGTVTGLTPGLHINLVAALTATFGATISSYISLHALACFLIAMAVTHTFIDSIPSIFLGAPDEAHALSALPGHRLLLEGKGAEAVIATVIGSLGALVLATILTPLLLYTIPKLQLLIDGKVAYILITILIIFIARENQPLTATCLWLFAGLLGWFVLNNNSIENPLFPMLSGLFGISTLLLSLKSPTTPPKQHPISLPTVNQIQQLLAIKAATLVGCIAAFLPGFGSSQAAILASSILPKGNDQQFLVLTGGINTVNMAVSLITLYTLGKGRNGVVVAITDLLGQLNLSLLILLGSTVLIAGGISVFVAWIITSKASQFFNLLPYRKTIITLIIAITIATYFMSDAVGLLILLTATSIGLLLAETKTGRHFGLGCLLLPTIVYLL